MVTNPTFQYLSSYLNCTYAEPPQSVLNYFDKVVADQGSYPAFVIDTLNQKFNLPISASTSHSFALVFVIYKKENMFSADEFFVISCFLNLNDVKSMLSVCSEWYHNIISNNTMLRMIVITQQERHIMRLQNLERAQHGYYCQNKGFNISRYKVPNAFIAKAENVHKTYQKIIITDDIIHNVRSPRMVTKIQSEIKTAQKLLNQLVNSTKSGRDWLQICKTNKFLQAIRNIKLQIEQEYGEFTALGNNIMSVYQRLPLNHVAQQSFQRLLLKK